MIVVDLGGKYTLLDALKISIATFVHQYPGFKPFHIKVSEHFYSKTMHLVQFPSQAGLIRLSLDTSLPVTNTHYFARILFSFCVSLYATPQVEELLVIYGQEPILCAS